MTGSKRFILGFALILILLMGGFLGFMKSRQGLLEPGVKVGPVSVIGETGKEVASQGVLIPEKVLDGVSSFNGPIANVELTGLPLDTTFGRRLFMFPDGFACQISVLLMGNDRTSIHQPQFCLVGQGWNITNTEQVSLRIDRPKPYDLPVMKLTSSKRFEQDGRAMVTNSIYIYWFVAKDRLCTGQFDRMWSTVNTIARTGKLERWAYVSYFAPCLPGQEQATFERLTRIINASMPEFQITTGSLSATPVPGV